MNNGKKKVQNDYKEYIEKIKKRQGQEYDTGKDIPLGRPKLLGWFWVISAIVLGVFITFVFISVVQVNNIIPFSIVIVFCYGLIVLSFIGGLRILKENSSKDSFWKIKKGLFVALSCVIILCIITIILNSTILTKTSTITTDIVQIHHQNKKDYLIVNDGQLNLSCSPLDCSKIFTIQLEEKGNANFKIEYQFSVLSPGKGKVIQIISAD